MRQLPVTDKNTQSSRIQEGLVHAGDCVDDAGNTNRVVGPAPFLAIDRNAAGDGAVDIGELVRLDVAVGPAGAQERAKVRRDLLLDIHADATAALIVPDGGDISRTAGDCSQSNRVRERPHAAAGEEPLTATLPGWPHTS